MKLLQKTNNIYLLLSIPIILLSMIFIFLLARHFNLRHVETNLREENDEIKRKAKQIKHYFIEDELSDELIIEQIPNEQNVEVQFSTVQVFDPILKEDKPYRQLETSLFIAGNNYKISIRKSLVESSTLIYSISISVLGLVILLSLSYLVLNRILSQSVWKPFYSILNSVKQFKAGKNYEALNKGSGIDEFDQLDNVLKLITERINKDFFIYKEFIDIVSHEYQTPLAVISNNAELLLQNKDLDESSYNNINEIIEYVRRLNKLNRSLLLLSRIDNKQFNNTKPTSIKELIKELIEEKKYQISHKRIEIKCAFEDNVNVQMDPMLANLLFRNLLQNAIRHNLKTDGHIVCEIRKGNFHMYNTGYQPKDDNTEIFSKFYKNSSTKNSIGLGLSIVKSICELYGYSVYYEYLNEKKEHHFMVLFNQDEAHSTQPTRTNTI